MARQRASLLLFVNKPAGRQKNKPSLLFTLYERLSLSTQSTIGSGKENYYSTTVSHSGRQVWKEHRRRDKEQRRYQAMSRR